MTHLYSVMLKLLRSSLGQVSSSDLFTSEEILQLTSPESVRMLSILSGKHDISHLVGKALYSLGVPHTGAGMEGFRKVQIQVVYRYEQLQYTLKELSGMFTDIQIPFIPLKGSVLRQYYPEPEMRTSCDIDILISPDHLEAVSQTLTAKLYYREIRTTAHDVQFLSPNGVLLELHFTLMDDKDYPEIAEILSKVWEYALPAADLPFRYELSPAFSYFYHTAHMVKHFLYGGCGIRTLMDLWIYNHCYPVSCRPESIALLTAGGIKTFEEIVYTISENWFSGTAYPPEQEAFLQQVEEYIIRGGIYGSTENKVRLSRSAEKNGLVYLLARLFPSMQRMKSEFPILQKLPPLLPFCYICRWFRLLSGKTGRRVLHELQVNSTVSAKEREDMQKMLSGMALNAHIIT